MRAPLRFHLATAFLALVGVVGVATLVHTYYASSRLLLAASDEEFTHIARETREHVAGLFEPARLQLDLLARHPVAEAASAAARLAELPVLAAALAANPDLAAIRVGYENGESFSVRRTAQGPVAEKGGRDPRLEPWYYRAPGSGEIVRTDLHAQPVTGDLAMTFSRRTGSGRGVVGVDIALGELSARLREHRVTPGSQIALADADGRVVGHPDTERLRRSDAPGGERRRLVSVFDLGQEPLAEVYVESHGRDRRSLLSLEGRQWIGESRAVGADWGAPILVLLAVPRDEILVGARKVAGEQLTVGLVALALALPLVWLLARALSQPLERLAAEARAIRAFDFARREPVRSRIIEVDELARATDEMRTTIREFLDRSTALAAEARLDRLLDAVVADAVRALGARGGELLLAGDAAAVPSGALAVPLVKRDGEQVGVLSLELHAPPEPAAIAFVQALAGTAAVAIETRHLIHAQKALLESLIRIVAGAIDAKSPYTGGHCQRVPALAKMLAEAACAAREGPFRDFRLDEAGWETLHIASWLHDCGKVTTPEYVVDKATKLETLYNRLHEVRMRFEVLKRDAEIACLKAIAAGAERGERVRALEAQWRELDDDFAFIARCNQGGESMSPADMARVRRIGARTWLRTLDDRIGLSQEEQRRRAGTPPAPPPAVERLLEDKPEHLVARPPAEVMPADNAWGFRLEPPAHKYNLGELHNLCVPRGTLTDEERYVINDHIVQTIVMLSRLPFPAHLRQVPEVAGGHHERMDGRGYPKGLRGADMSALARMMAIADVYEALTAADRPYKTGKKVSEALAIMRRMAEEGHIDPDLFRLFVEAGVYLRYAERFLDPAQIDAPGSRRAAA